MSAAKNRTNAVWLRAQLADLNAALTGSESVSAPQVHQALDDILHGRPWRPPTNPQ